MSFGVSLNPFQQAALNKKPGIRFGAIAIQLEKAPTSEQIAEFARREGVEVKDVFQKTRYSRTHGNPQYFAVTGSDKSEAEADFEAFAESVKQNPRRATQFPKHDANGNPID